MAHVKDRIISLTLVDSEARLVVMAMEVAASYYRDRAAAGDLTEKLAQTFDGYADKLDEFAKEAQDTEHVEFSYFADLD